MAGEHDNDTNTEDTSTADTGASSDVQTSATDDNSGGSSTGESLLDAINEGIADASPKPKGETNDDTADTPAKEGDEEVPADGTTTRDAQGRFVAKPKDGEQAPGAKPAEAKDGKTQTQQSPGEVKPAAAKQPDPINDPIPAEVKGKTRERMESLISVAKELTTARDQAVTERAELLGYVAETKATPQQFTDALQYLKAINSGDPAQIRQAIKVVQSELVALARRIGEPVPGVDLLTEHQDLKEAVEAGDISRAHAEELAAARALRTTQQQTTQQRTEQERVQQDIVSGKTALNNLDAQLRDSDPQYAAKRAVLVPMLQPVLAHLHPSKWADAFKQAYDKLPANFVTPPSNTTTPTTTPQQRQTTQQQQPLRAKQSAGQGGAKAPASLLDAINLALEDAAGR